jgi:tyrosinase
MLHLRRSLVLLPLFYLVNTLAVAQYSGYDYGFDVHQLVKRQIGRRSDLVVNGTTPDDGIRIRQEIRELEKDQDLWTLYILALSMLQFTDQSYPLSYYSLAGLCPPLISFSVIHFPQFPA